MKIFTTMYRVVEVMSEMSAQIVNGQQRVEEVQIENEEQNSQRRKQLKRTEDWK